jgi:hypothetical protein
VYDVIEARVGLDDRTVRRADEALGVRAVDQCDQRIEVAADVRDDAGL